MNLLVANLSCILGNTLYLKPSEPPDLSKFSLYNRDFVRFDPDFERYFFTKDPGDFHVEWEKYKISGICLLKGKHNICYFEGLYYFLDEMQYLYEDIYRYKLVRWFWVNDCLNNSRLRITGTLQKTSQVNTVSENILFTTPILQSGNEITFYNIQNIPDDERKSKSTYSLIKPENFMNSLSSHFVGLIPVDLSEYPGLLESIKASKFSPNLKNIPVIITPSIHKNWKGYFLSNLLKFLEKSSLKIYDISQTEQSSTFATLLSKHKDNEGKFYVISDSTSGSLRYFAKADASNNHWIPHIDLSSLTDVQKIRAGDLEIETPSFLPFSAISSRSIVSNVKRVMGNCSVGKIEEVSVKTFKDKVLEDSNLGDLTTGDSIFFKYDNQADIIVGYEFKDDGSIDLSKPITRRFVNDPYSYLVNLSKYKIISSSSEIFNSNSDDERYQRFLVGEDREFDENDWLKFAITVLPKEEGGKPLEYFVTFKQINLIEGFTINGKSYVQYAYIYPLKATDLYSATSKIILDTKEFKDKQKFATLLSKKIWWSMAKQSGYEETEKHAKKNDELTFKKLEGTEDETSYSKLEVRTILKDLIKNFNYEAVGNLLDGVILQFPSDGSGKSFGSLVGSNFYIDDLLKPETLNQYVYIQPLALNTNISSDNYNLDLHEETWTDQNEENEKVHKFQHKGQVVDKLGDFISLNDLQEKVEEWFKYWKDKSKDGDFLLNKQVGFLTISDDLSWLCYDISKIHNEKQYKITLLFKRNHNENNPQLMRTSVTFRDVYHSSVSAGNNGGNFSVYLGTEINRLMLPFHICSKTKKFPMGEDQKNRSIGQKGQLYYSDLLSSDNKNNSEEKCLYRYERYYKVSFKVPTVDDELEGLEYSEVNTDHLIKPGDYYSDFKNLSVKYGSELIEWEEGEGLYDLVGTNFYVYKKKTKGNEGDYYELIIKNNSESIEESIKTEKGVFTSSPLNDLAKVINSQNMLYAYGETIPLKWRGFLNKSHRFDFFSLTFVPLPANESYLYDVYELIIKTDCDYIRKYFQVMKKQSEFVGGIDLVKYEEMTQKIKTEQKMSSLNFRELGLNKERFYESMRNSQEDINNMVSQRYWNLIGGAFDVLGSVVSGRYDEAFKTAGSSVKKYFDSAQEINLARRNYNMSMKYGSEEFKIQEDRMNVTYSALEAKHRRMLLSIDTNVNISAYSESTLYRAIKEKFKTGDVYLMNLRTDGKQYEELKRYYDMFGYDLTLNDYSVFGSELNRGLVIKFSKVLNVEGIEDPVVANAVKEIFESGFKII